MNEAKQKNKNEKKTQHRVEKFQSRQQQQQHGKEF